MPTEFFVNTDAILAGSSRIGHITTNMLSGQVKSLAREALISVFEAACEIANSDDGFPEEFQSHLLNAVKNLDINIITVPGEVFVSVDFDELGNRQDLERAFHQGAQLEGGGRLWGPYEGQALKNDDAEERHIFWEAIRFGRPRAQVHGKNIKVNSNYTWEDTIQQYINIWGEKAPEWLFIQFGQEEWEPYVPQWDIIADFYSTFNVLLETSLTALVEHEVAIANSYQSLGVETGFTSKGQPRLLSSSVMVRGKSYRAGQFIPKNV